jgi:maltoporin
MKTDRFLFLIAAGFLSVSLSAQMSYEYAKDKTVTVGTYGRIGVDWSFDNNGSIGRRLNLNNMGSVGGRLEEQDYMEFATALQFKPFREDDSTRIITQMRLAAYSTSLSLFANTSTSAAGGLTLAIPELFLEARNINDKHVNIWIGARLYRGPDVHIADYRYFNDYSGQGFGVEFKNTRFATLFISSTDTSANYPPYFYLNIATGTPSLAMRQRTAWTIQHDLNLGQGNILTLLGEYHHLGNASSQSDTVTTQYNFPSDYGLVAGARLETTLKSFDKSYNRFAIRYGTRIANGGDGGLSRTWLTFGAPDLEKNDFSGAYSITLVDEIMINQSRKASTNAYIIYTRSKGAASSDGLAESYLEKEVFNRKEDFTAGMREVYFLTDKFHLLGEIHFSQRKDGTEDWARCTKISFAPVLVPTGNKDYWARPQIRFVSSVAFYNDYARDHLYSPYLQFTGAKSVGYYLGFKAEWWIWN